MDGEFRDDVNHCQLFEKDSFSRKQVNKCVNLDDFCPSLGDASVDSVFSGTVIYAWGLQRDSAISSVGESL
jgi:hypothetical protein